MKTLFVMPKVGAWASHGIHKAPNQLYAQLGAYLREKNIGEIKVLDARALDMSTEEMLEEVKKDKPDVVILGDMVHSYGGFAVMWYFNETARLIKKLCPKTKIIVGGLWYSGYFKETLEQNPWIDFVYIGEAELTVEELLLALENGDKDLENIPGVAFRKDGQVVRGPHRELIKDLNTLPLPAYDLFPMDRYVGHTYWRPFVEIITSRGCPNACSFCYEWSEFDAQSPKDFLTWRAKSSKRVVDELEVLEKKYGVKVVVIQDDTYNVDAKRLKETCDEILKRNLSIKWVMLGIARDWVRQKELIPLMKKAGMFMGVVGIEVSSDEELKKIGKNITTSQVKETIDVLRENDIATVGTLLVGLEDDSEEVIKKRCAFADEIDPDVLWIGLVTPPPGSPIWRSAVKRGWVDPNHIDLKLWDFQHPVVPTKYLSKEQVGHLAAWGIKQFYNNPKRIKRIMESNYDILAKLCFNDQLHNFMRFEKAATKGEILV